MLHNKIAQRRLLVDDQYRFVSTKNSPQLGRFWDAKPDSPVADNINNGNLSTNGLAES